MGKDRGGREPRAVIHRLHLPGTTRRATDQRRSRKDPRTRRLRKSGRGRGLQGERLGEFVNEVFHLTLRSKMPTKDKLIIALDVETPTQALDLVKQLHS